MPVSSIASTSSGSEGPQHRPRLPGFADGIGERVLVFETSSSSWLELLRFKREFSEALGFETALRKRLEDLSVFRHPSIAVARKIERASAGDDLMLVSNHTAGRRLSEILQDASGAAFAVELIGQLAPALAALQSQGAGMAHGVLTADRIIVTREGRLVITEHVLASAMSVLRLPAARVRAELQLPVAQGTDPVAFDGRSDVLQLGYLALSMLLGRRLEPTDFLSKAPSLFAELEKRTENRAPVAPALRRWLERALQIDGRAFNSAQEANEAFADVPKSEAVPEPKSHLVAVPSPADKSVVSEADATSSSSDAESSTAAPSRGRSRKFGVSTLVAAAAVMVALLEGGVIAFLLASPATVHLPTLEATQPEPLASAPQVIVQAPAPQPSASLVPALPPAEAPAAALDAKAAPPTKPADPVPAPGVGRFGGLKVASTIELQVLEGGKVVGSTAAPVALSEGSHQVELVNDVLGFRTRATVDVKPGQMTSMTLAVPNGRVSINAAPWASVWIDGAPAGDTPLANVAVPIGSHEIVFKHPQFGDQKQTAVIKADGLTRVSVNMQRPGGGGQ